MDEKRECEGSLSFLLGGVLQAYATLRNDASWLVVSIRSNIVQDNYLDVVRGIGVQKNRSVSYL